VEILILDFQGVWGRLENPVFGFSRLSRAPSFAHGIVELNLRKAIRIRPRHDGESRESIILTAQDELSRDLASPLLDSSLQCPQLSVGKNTRMLFLKLLKKIFGTSLRASLQLFQEMGPDRFKRVGPGTPSAWRSFSFLMRRSYFAFFPSRSEILQESFCGEFAAWFRRGTLFRGHEFLLPGTDVLQELNGIQRNKSCWELLLDRLRDLIGGEQAVIGRGGCVILLGYFRSEARLGFQFEGGLKEVDVVS